MAKTTKTEPIVDPPQRPPFAPIARNEPLADKVAAQLIALIEEERLPSGTRLPPERELGERFGVSRTVIREALRSVSAKGLIEARSGSGLHVTSIGGTQITESMRLFLRGHAGTAYKDVNAVRSVLEIATVKAAVRQATDDEIQWLGEIHQRMVKAPDVEAASEADVEFHRAIAKLTHNELFVVLLDSIGDVLLDIRRATLGIPSRPEVGVRFHQRILERIAARDADGAELAMREHLNDAVEAWRELQPQIEAADDSPTS